jgi:pyruvate kinase
MRRQRCAKIIATLGPATSSPEAIRDLFFAGADVFRLNFSHGTPDDHRQRLDIIRQVEAETERPIAALLDLQGPKLRVGKMRDGVAVSLEAGSTFRLDLDHQPGDQRRASLPHPEVFQALRRGTALLLDDGRIRLEVTACGEDFADCVVRTGGALSDHKGVNVPDVVLPVSPFTEKDERDLAFGCASGWARGPRS